MKTKDITALRAMDAAQLVKEVGVTRKKYSALEMQRQTKPGKNSREVKFMRQRIAVIQTLIREKELAHG